MFDPQVRTPCSNIFQMYCTCVFSLPVMTCTFFYVESLSWVFHNPLGGFFLPCLIFFYAGGKGTPLLAQNDRYQVSLYCAMSYFYSFQQYFWLLLYILYYSLLYCIYSSPAFLSCYFETSGPKYLRAGNIKKVKCVLLLSSFAYWDLQLFKFNIFLFTS